MKRERERRRQTPLFFSFLFPQFLWFFFCFCCCFSVPLCLLPAWPIKKQIKLPQGGWGRFIFISIFCFYFFFCFYRKKSIRSAAWKMYEKWYYRCSKNRFTIPCRRFVVVVVAVVAVVVVGRQWMIWLLGHCGQWLAALINGASASSIARRSLAAAAANRFSLFFAFLFFVVVFRILFPFFLSFFFLNRGISRVASHPENHQKNCQKYEDKLGKTR